METQNLWPDFDTEEIKGPKAILIEQAKYLAEKTNGLLSADVVTNRFKGKFTHTLCIIAPLLDNYRYGLFSVEHEALYYPATVSWDVPSEDRRLGKIVNDSEELIERLRVIFNSPDTVKIISSLLSQSKAEKEGILS